MTPHVVVDVGNTRIKWGLVAPDGGPLSIVDQKGKKQKYQVYAREGYQATKGGVGD